MKWRDKFSHSNIWKSTDNFVLCRAHGTYDVVAIWDRVMRARLVPSWSHTQVFSSKDAQPPTKFKDRHYPHQNSEANKMRVEKKWWKKLDKLLSVNTQPLLRNSQVLNKDVCVCILSEIWIGIQKSYNPSMSAWILHSRGPVTDRWLLRLCWLDVLPAFSPKSLCLMLQGQHFQNNNRPTV